MGRVRFCAELTCLDIESQELAVNRQMGKFIDILGQMENQ
jgi:hypothetical protein